MYVRHKALPTNCPNPPSSPSAPEQNCRHMTDCSGALGLCPLITELLSIFGRATPYSTCATGSATKAPSVPFAHTLVPPLLLIQLAIFSVHAPYFPPPILPVTTVRSASFTKFIASGPLGGHFTIMDATSSRSLRLPSWTLPTVDPAITARQSPTRYHHKWSHQHFLCIRLFLSRIVLRSVIEAMFCGPKGRSNFRLLEVRT